MEGLTFGTLRYIIYFGLFFVELLIFNWLTIPAAFSFVTCVNSTWKKVSSIIEFLKKSNLRVNISKGNCHNKTYLFELTRKKEFGCHQSLSHQVRF